ncbi:MAG: hypothetical protein CO189_07750 [candidate division Zixibacteria bacterium CG_4_9_14_3_um_filter_46_8]|nr:MAG: hypothetical protein CO189_07750 [candidate division Zixibacteria bacterium CG_4_9_14_3_um_filter_46_8]
MSKRILILMICILMTTNAAVLYAKQFPKMTPIPSIKLTPDTFEPYFKPTLPLDDTLNVRINSDESGQIQNEQQICINPTNPDNVVAVWRDFRLGYRRIGVGHSFDGGLTWSDDLFPNSNNSWMSDPGLTYDVDGNFYALSLTFDAGGDYSGFEIFTSTDGGVIWSEPVQALYTPTSDIFEDKELIACDRTPDSPYQGNMYIAWTRFTYQPEYSTDCCVIRTIDGNQTWEEPIYISEEPGLQWPVPVVGAGGVVYVAWVGFSFSTITLDRSFDGGATWDADIPVAYVAAPYVELNGGIATFSYPAMDADISGGQYHGNLYMAYMDWSNYDFDLYFRKSYDQGYEWTPAVRINDDEWDNGCDQFHPWLTVDENGVISVMFYDRRNDPVDNLPYDIYMTQSFDAGDTWTPNLRITTVSSDPTSGGVILAGLIGEYSGIAVRDGVANLVWTDFRLGDQDAFGSRVHTYTESSIDDGTPAMPVKPLLVSNYPNPFNASTSIRISIPYKTDLNIAAYDMTGRKVAEIANSRFEAGTHTINWSPDGLSSGIYFVRLKSPSGSVARKVVLLK